jgi:N-acetylglucosaminyl-diphospho-decaprenol L-rhamnosyltransferase
MSFFPNGGQRLAEPSASIAPVERAPDVSVVMVNFRTAELALEALAAARASAGSRLALEEVIVDSGSGDGSVERLRAGRPDAKLVALPENRGFAAGNNAGIAAASGRTLLLLNSDAFPVGDAVRRLVTHLDSHPQVGIAAPALLNRDGSAQLNASKRFPGPGSVFVDFCFPLGRLLYGRRGHPMLVARGDYDTPRRIAHATAAALLVRAEAARDAGPLDEGFFLYLEETEWQKRFAPAGWEVHLVPDARVTHLTGQSGLPSHSFASEHYLASLRRYHGGSRSAVWAARAGAAISMLAARIAALARPRDPRFPTLAAACRDVLRRL